MLGSACAFEGRDRLTAQRTRGGVARPASERSRFYEFCARACVGFLKLFYKPELIDIHHVPAEGGVILASNHQSFLDPPLIGGFVGWRQFAFMAQSYLFKVPVLGSMIRALNSVPVSGSGGDTASIKALVAALKDGRPVVVFPEGSRTPDGAMQPAKRGVVLLMRRAKCPVVPVAIEGVFDAWPRTRKLPRLFGYRFMVKYGAPIPPEDLREDDALERVVAEIDRMRLEIRALLRERTNGKQPAAGPGDQPAQTLTESPRVAQTASTSSPHAFTAD